MNEKTRRDFEAWMLQTGRQSPGCYWSEAQEELYAAWLASRNSALEEAAGDLDKLAAEYAAKRNDDIWCGYADTGLLLGASAIRARIKE